LAPPDVEALFGDAGFSASQPLGGGRPQLILDPRIGGRQRRVGARPPLDVGGLLYFVGALNRWLPANQPRLLWISDWSSPRVETDDDFVLAARRGFGEVRAFSEAPGHYFEVQPWDEQDQADATRHLSAALSALAGLASMMMITGSDGWLIAGGTSDRIEFWEGNLFLYAEAPARLREAEALLEAFQCPDLA